MLTKILPGDIVAIPLPNGRFAFGKVLKDASIGIYKFLAECADKPPPAETDFLFTVGIYRDVLASGDWPVVARQRFENEEQAWPPPYAVRDAISGKCSVYHKGQIRPSSAEECATLEPAAVWDRQHIIERIVTSM